MSFPTIYLFIILILYREITFNRLTFILSFHFFARYISYCLPLTQATTALRCMLTRGWGIMEQEVYLGFISTLTWIALFLAITMIVLRLKRG